MAYLQPFHIPYVPFFPISPYISPDFNDALNYQSNYYTSQSGILPSIFQNNFTQPFAQDLLLHQTNQRNTHKPYDGKMANYQSESISIVKNEEIPRINRSQIPFPFINSMMGLKRNKPLTLIQAIETIVKYKQEYKKLKDDKQKYVSKTACRNLQLNKKTVDDYQMYIRLGIHFNLIKEENLNMSFGIFRKEVKLKRQNSEAKWAKPEDLDIVEFYHNLILQKGSSSN